MSDITGEYGVPYRHFAGRVFGAVDAY